MSTVLQPWVEELPWKMQSILFSGLRGPDEVFYSGIKNVSKWMRAVSQNNADPSKPYMNDFMNPEPDTLEKELEHLPCHFVHHFCDSLTVIAYNHPNKDVRKYAYSIVAYVCEEIFHFLPEHPQIFKWRHRDKKNGLDSRPEPPFNDRQWMDCYLPDGWVHY